MLVSDLPSTFSTIDEETLTVDLGDIEIEANACYIEVDGDKLILDEVAEKALATYLKIPTTYLANCPPGFKAQTLRFWRDENPDAQTVLEVVEGQLVNAHGPDVLTIPLPGVADVMAKVFDSQAQVKTCIRSPQLFHLDVVTPLHEVNVVPVGRQTSAIGDITQAGVRVLVHPFSDKPPSVSKYFERLICTNGMCREESAGAIRIKGQTVDDVLEEMEMAANRILGQLDDDLSSYAKTASMRTPGTPTAFAYQLGREQGLRQPVMDIIMAHISQLPADASVYDVMNVFTDVANRLPYAQRMRMQALGGSLALDTERMVHRCQNCEQKLP